MDLLFYPLSILLKGVVSLTALTTLLSFTVAWYERSNANPSLIERRFTTRGIGLSIWLMVQETACLLITLILRPLGWLPVRIPTDPAPTRPPVILLHGLFQNRSCMFWLQHRLKQAGFTHVFVINTPPWRDIETLTEVLSKTVDQVRLQLKVDKVVLVGHSMGGMIARNYVVHRGGASRVAACVTLGTPHAGSKLAPFAVSPMGKSLLPGSDFMLHFNSLPWPQGPRGTAIYTRHDNIVLPANNARLEGVANVELEGMGHTALLFHPAALEAVADALEDIR